MTEISNKYTNLIPLQYYSKPKAKAFIEFFEIEGNKILELAEQVRTAFLIDTAVGEQLNIIGNRVGISRDKVNNILIQESLPSITDENYRFIIKFKIIVNTNIATIGNNRKQGLQEAFSFAFDNQAVVQDSLNRYIKLILNPTVDISIINLITKLGLLPNIQGLPYYLSYSPREGYFGFAEDSNALGFNDGTGLGGGLADVIIKQQ